MLENIPPFSHDQFKRFLDISISKEYQQYIDTLQKTRLGKQYDQNNNSSGSWTQFVYNDVACSQAIGIIDPSTKFISQAENNLTWPLYAQIYNIKDSKTPFSNCAQAKVEWDEDKDKDDKVARVTSFDIQFKIPAGPKVAIILAISERLNQSFNVVSPVKKSLRNLLDSIIDNSKKGIAANVNVIKINSEGDLEPLFDGNANAATSAGINSILSQLSPEAPDNPSIAAIRNHSLVKEATGGWLLLFAGDSYDEEMSLVYLNMARYSDDPEDRADNNIPSRIRLFTLDNCSEWTGTLEAIPGFQGKGLVQCKSVNEPQESFAENLIAAINELVGLPN